MKAGRNPGRVAAALEGIRRAAGTADPLMPHIIDAVRSRATLGEISDALRDVWGSFRPTA